MFFKLTNRTFYIYYGDVFLGHIELWWTNHRFPKAQRDLYMPVISMFCAGNIANMIREIQEAFQFPGVEFEPAQNLLTTIIMKHCQER